MEIKELNTYVRNWKGNNKINLNKAEEKDL